MILSSGQTEPAQARPGTLSDRLNLKSNRNRAHEIGCGCMLIGSKYLLLFENDIKVLFIYKSLCIQWTFLYIYVYVTIMLSQFCRLLSLLCAIALSSLATYLGMRAPSSSASIDIIGSEIIIIIITKLLNEEYSRAYTHMMMMMMMRGQKFIHKTKKPRASEWLNHRELWMCVDVDVDEWKWMDGWLAGVWSYIYHQKTHNECIQ